MFPNEDHAYLLAFSLIMLNTDLHNPSIKHKMTCEQFVKNNTNTGLEQDLTPEFLSRMFECIKEKEIKMDNEDTTSKFS
jgi:brefeldin A-inhibited guanine nucleotide-exchange protein